MKSLLLATAILMSSVSAQAWEVSSKCNYSRFYGTSSCRTVGIADQPRQVQNYADDEQEFKARQLRISKWEAFCRPVRTYDKEGVARLVYAHAGCDVGRSE